MKTLIFIILIFIILFIVVLLLALLFGGPKKPVALKSISSPFKAVDYSNLPPVQFFLARDAEKLAFRTYRPTNARATKSIVLVHGSSATSKSMHVLAIEFASNGYTVYALDIRGHGESGTKGNIAYIGQLEDDLEDFILHTKPQKPSTLAGFSSGGGFVLRFAGDTRQKLFSSYLLLSPFISQDAPTYRPNSGGWANVGIPRTIAISILNAIGIKTFNNLPATIFAVDESSQSPITAKYSYALSENFRPLRNYTKNIGAVKLPISLIAGENDEVFKTDKFKEVFTSANKDISITLLPNIGHTALILEKTAIQTAVSVVEKMTIEN